MLEMQLSEQRCLLGTCVCLTLGHGSRKTGGRVGLPCSGRAELTVEHLDMQKELEQGDVSVGACLDMLVYIRTSFGGEVLRATISEGIEALR